MSQGFPLSNRSRRDRHLLVMSPEPSELIGEIEWRERLNGSETAGGFATHMRALEQGLALRQLDAFSREQALSVASCASRRTSHALEF